MAFIGIDLGTTLSAVARPSGKVVEVLPNEEGNLLTPSAVYIPDGNLSQAIVGESALKMLHSEEKINVVRWVKRLIGTNQKIKTRRKNGTIAEFTPTEISSAILQKLKRDAENFMDEPVEGAVITVPAWFGLKQCEEVMIAGQLANLKVLQLIPEPQAAAIDYSMDQNLDFNNKTIFVYDLGGGTFDATLISLQQQFRSPEAPVLHFVEIAKEGSRELGGYDWDKQLLKHCCEVFDQKHSTDSHLETTEDLELEAEQVKKLLSKLIVANFNITTRTVHDVVEVTREQFQEITRHLLEETRSKVRQTLRKANKTWEEVSYILIVGGASQMPMVFHMMEEEVSDENHQKICRHKGVNFNVARGAAYVAGDFVKVEKTSQFNPDIEEGILGDTMVMPQIIPSKKPDIGAITKRLSIPKWSTPTPNNIASQTTSKINSEPSPASLTSQSPQSEPSLTNSSQEFIQLSNIVVKRRLKDQDAIGVTGIKRGLAVNAIILPPQTYTDEEHVRTFPLAEPNMTEVTIIINRGASEDLSKVEQDKGRFILQGLPPNRPSGCLVEITMKMDRNGMLSVKARDLETNQYCNTTIQLDPIS